MKPVIVFTFLYLISSSLKAQTNNMGSTKNQYYFKSDSIETIIRPTQNEVVCMSILIKGGVSNYTFLEQGIEPLAINCVLHGATKNYSESQISEILYESGLRIESQYTVDYTILTFTFPISSWDESWKILSEILLNPVFQTSNYEAAKQETEADAAIWLKDNYASSLTESFKDIFANKQLDKTPFGEGNFINNISLEQARKYYSGLITRSRIVLSVVGNITEAQVKNKIKTEWSSMPLGYYSNFPYQSVDLNTSTFKFQSQINYSKNIFTCISSGPEAFSDDEIKLSVILKIIQARLIEKNNQNKIAFDDPLVSLSNNIQPLSIIQFTSNNADKTMQALIDEIKKIKKYSVGTLELQKAKDNFLISYYTNNESNKSMSIELAKQIYFHQKDYYDRIENVLSNFEVLDVPPIIKKYIKAFKIYYNGNVESANSIVFIQKLE